MLETYPRTTQQIEKLSKKEMEELFNNLIIHLYRLAGIDNLEREISRLTQEIEQVIACIDKKNKAVALGKGTIATIAFELISLVEGWTETEESERSDLLKTAKTQSWSYRKKHRSNKIGR